ncbi:RNA-directed DNA polymerase, eukaryota, reverse transcriptase zinc-binding domain protein [Tanacetum coccineum]|uniref:RNA-directed DNA polymerase, eukaryota, reverse transcriptase zinc-binding domain protein n=1 Tax=Tanacetum coccineum TaxID=301880 RepID=A0ABQ5HWQ5_9ASTR
MKRYMRNLNRVNGNVFDKVKALRVELKRVQTSLDKDPDCIHLSKEEFVYCNAYKEAMNDEEKVLRQKTKFSGSRKGIKYEGDGIAPKFVDHFQKFLGVKDDVFPIDDLDGLFTKKLDSQCADLMVRPILVDEIKYAMFYIEDDKAAGPDGFSSKFFKAAWSILGMMFVLRPIACCNVVYKCISKVIVNRLKEGLGSIINCNQSAFISGRKISDNILLAQEFMNGYGCRGGAQRCAFKVDIEKAELHGFFKGKRGLRQGDPMSPYLFAVVMEVFNLMVQRQICLDDRFKYHWGCRRIKLTHLCFVDDLLMLCHGDHISASILRRALDEFSKSSGLYPSMAKSTVFYGNVPDSVKDDVNLAMPFREGVLPVRYLGVPLTAKKLSIADCLVLTEKLVAYVLSSLHVYWASMFILPVSVCNNIDKLLKNFVWSKTDSSKGIASVAWKDVCRPKKQGGLGLKSLRVMNHALMVKHLWNTASKKDSLWVKWLNVYRIKGNCIWELKSKKIIWHSNGPLCRCISNNVITYNGFDLNAKVSDLIDENGPNMVLDCNDKALWFNKENEVVRFSVKEAWKVLRDDVPKVLCCKDSHSHLFYQCGFSQGIWERLKVMCRLEDLSLVLGAVVYFIWQERNFRLFRSVKRPADKVCDVIVDTVRLRLLGLKIKRSLEVDKAAAIWKLPIKGDGEKWDSTFGGSSTIGIVDISIGTTSSFFRPYACDHPVVITTSDWVGISEVGWVRLGYLIWVGAIRECRVDFSSVAVLIHRIGSHKGGGLFFEGFGELWFWCCIFLYINNGYVADVSLGLGLFGFWGSRIFGKGLGSVWHGSAIVSLGLGYVRISSTGFWMCNTIYIIDKGFSMFGIDCGCSEYIASVNCNDYDQLWFDFCSEMYKGSGYKMDSEYKVLV